MWGALGAQTSLLKLLVPLVLAAVFVLGCGGVPDAPPTPTPAPPTPTPAPPTPTPAPVPAAVLTPTIALAIDSHTLTVELATTPEQRAQGLMFRTEMPADYGMLFVFPDDRPRSFWMRNTFLPLSIAFLDAERRILNIEQMAPRDDQPPHYESNGPARYALEVNQGWFEARAIAPGATVVFTLPPDTEIR